MEMNSPIGPNALDEQRIVGKAIDRLDGPLKVSGGARYAYEIAKENVLYGFVVEASIGKGTVRSIDTRAAEKAPGVVLVLTHQNAPAQGTGNHREAHPVLTGPQVTRYGQPVAFVVAQTFEQARAAAYLVGVKYDRFSGRYALRPNLDRALVPHQGDGAAADSAIGDFATAFASAPVKIDVIYTTPLKSNFPTRAPVDSNVMSFTQFKKHYLSALSDEIGKLFYSTETGDDIPYGVMD